ncbi:MAG TPA: AbrB/MazE/SpoVT family DNA-binding domain-containing protein [Actinomycetota bacterium]
MVSISMRKKGQLTLPAAIREAAHLEEGDPIAVELTPDGILLRPQKVIDATQAWFWRADWQEGEREASDDGAAGRLTRTTSDEDFLASLDD